MISTKQEPSPSVIGSTEYVDVAGIKHIPAKIDTGADSSSIWASHIEVTKDGVLRFCLFDEGSPYYTGEVFEHKDYKVVVVRNAFGHEQIRYRTYIPITIQGRRIKALFHLADRSRNNFPILVGRRTISGKFLVDVKQNHTPTPTKKPKTRLIQRRLKEDPYEFHRRYIQELGGNVDNIKLNQKGAAK